MARSHLALALLLGLSGVACGGGPAEPETAASPLTGKKPGEAYTAYVSAIGNATEVHEIYPFLAAAARRAVTSDIEVLKAKVPAGVLKIQEEKIEGDKATLRVEASIRDTTGKEQPSSGAIRLLREGGLWKVESETWAPK